MGADNWTNCPKCEEKAQIKKDKLIDKCNNEYGNITMVKFLEMKKQADEPVILENSLREDYEIGIYEGRFEVNYTASCSTCGFEFSFKEKKETK